MKLVKLIILLIILILLIGCVLSLAKHENKCLGIYVQPPPYENKITYFNINVTFTIKTNETKCKTINFIKDCTYYSFNKETKVNKEIKCYKETKELYLNVYTTCKIKNCEIIYIGNTSYILIVLPIYITIVFIIVFIIIILVLNCKKDKYDKF